MIVKDCKLTTHDNPFDPYEQFDSWYLFDMEKGYDCCGKLNRLSNFEDDMTQIEIHKEIENAIDKLIAIDFTNTYKKVTRNVEYPD